MKTDFALYAVLLSSFLVLVVVFKGLLFLVEHPIYLVYILLVATVIGWLFSFRSTKPPL